VKGPIGCGWAKDRRRRRLHSGRKGNNRSVWKKEVAPAASIHPEQKKPFAGRWVHAEALGEKRFAFSDLTRLRITLSGGYVMHVARSEPSSCEVSFFILQVTKLQSQAS
jgi:hypothetical protein